MKETHHKQKINSPSIRVEKRVLIKVKRRKINLLVGVVAVIARGGAGGGRKQWTLEGVANRDRQRGSPAMTLGVVADKAAKWGGFNGA